jgi:hypothetical protein
MDVRVHRTPMTRIERIDANLIGFYPFAGSALACGVQRGLILLANSFSAGGARDISQWLSEVSPPAHVPRPSGAENNFAEYASSISPRRLAF